MIALGGTGEEASGIADHVSKSREYTTALHATCAAGEKKPGHVSVSHPTRDFGSEHKRRQCVGWR